MKWEWSVGADVLSKKKPDIYHTEIFIQTRIFILVLLDFLADTSYVDMNGIFRTDRCFSTQGP